MSTDARPDIAITVSPSCPAPVKKYLGDALSKIGLEVEATTKDVSACLLPSSKLEAHAEKLGLEVELRYLELDMKLRWSEECFPVREYSAVDRNLFQPFTPSHRAFITLDFIDKNLTCDQTWKTALVASGLSEAAANPKSEWLVGPGNDWVG